MRSLFAAVALVFAAMVSSGCASGPPPGSSAAVHDIGSLVLDVLPPETHKPGEIALDALIQLSEYLGLTKEQFRAVCQECDLAVDAVPGPRSPASEADAATRARAKAYIEKLQKAGR